ncbi:uncharacterized protein I303_105882 [Kwoniella dejecticola CBS 10117]|uniref:Nuclear protein n=1 Tax=Kwoniella dejecticola CBS 10117 TaxID=1296121 RepID=A0A1A6A0N6_9TREE|nr:nuclear protein [Kwoniella dejecticola CBS 10117]OBR83624.1 nuclear protein [Kwoniella dejecticola CBS 10117]
MNFYKSAALALDHLEKNQGSVKGSLAAAGIKSTPGEGKRILALVIETLKYKPVLLELLTTVPLLSLEKLTFPKKVPRGAPSSRSLLLVLLHDLLFSSKNKIEASDLWPPKPALLKHQARLKGELVKLQIKKGKSRKEDLAVTSSSSGSGDLYRYIRYNSNYTKSLADLHEELERLGYTRLPKGEGVGKEKYPLGDKEYFEDEHLGEVLFVFNGATTWWNKSRWYEDGGIILQDKASCMPAKVLMWAWEDDEGECIDATAAPGNKTSYVSALMGNKGILHAFERSPNRYKTLTRMLEKAHCKNVKAQRADFLESDPKDGEYKKVTRILLDPSCSGSGIVNRLDYLLEDDVEESDSKTERLEKLASFQLQMILHAFKFPSARRIVYSTCSIHPEEDERVVLAALQSKIAKDKGWKLAPREQVIPSWERRGRPEEIGGDEDLAQGVIRCLPEDRTNGFFVSCFVRDDPAGLSISNITQPGSESASKAEDGKGNGTKSKTKTKAEAAVKSSNKRPRGVDDEESGDAERVSYTRQEMEREKAKTEDVKVAGYQVQVNETTENVNKEKTSAQLERNKRKKAAQKEKAKKRKLEA